MEKASDFIKKHTKELNGKEYINAVEAIIELYARIQGLQGSIKALNESIEEIGAWGITVEKKLKELKGEKTIEVVTESEAKASGIKFYKSPNDKF
jgi:prefoldin subunit 5